MLICAPTARAQYRFDHWTADNGLPQNSVRDIMQTRDGYLWLATFDGLVRFDGVRFTVFTKSNTPGIISSRFVHLYEDAQGDLWVSTESGGLTRRHAGRFTSYTTAQGLPANLSHSLGGDGQGNLLLFFGSRLFRWAEGKFLPADELRVPASVARSERQEQALHLPCYSDRLSRVACFVDGQLRAWTPADFALGDIFNATQDRHGVVWFYSAQALVKVEQGRVVAAYRPGHGLPGAQPRIVYGRQPLQAFTRDAGGSLWLTDLAALQSHLVAQQPPAELVDIVVGYGDREGNYWFGTTRNGLFRARRESITAYSTAQGLHAEEVYPICEDGAGAIWIGTAGHGLFRFAGGAFTHYRAPALFGNYVTSLHQDRAGQLWVNGAWRFDGERFVRGISAEVLPASLSFVWTRHEDRAGALWFGAERGVLRYQDGVAMHYTTQDGLAGDDTKVIIEDGARGLWLGSYGGLTHYQDGRFTKWTESDGLPGHTVRALYQDAAGTL